MKKNKGLFLIFLLFSLIAEISVTYGADRKIQVIFQELLRLEEESGMNKDSAYSQIQFKIEELKNYKNRPDSLLGYAYFIASETKRYGAEYEMSRKYLDSAQIAYSKGKNMNGLGKVWHGIGNIYLLTGQLDSALACYQKALHIKRGFHNLVEESKTVVNIGIAFYKMNQLDSALYYYSESLRLRTQVKDTDGIVASLSNIGNIYLYQNNFDEAQTYYKKALELLDTTRITRQLASILNNMGTVYNREGRYSLALENFMQAIRLYEAFGDRAAKVKIFNNIALIHFELNHISKALEYHTQALTLSLEIHDHFGIADSYYYIGRINHLEKDYETALQNFTFALGQKKLLGQSSDVADCMQNIGVVYLDTQQPDSARYYFYKAIEIYKNTGNKYGQATCYINLSELNLLTYQYLPAIREAQHALNLANSYQGLLEMMLAYEKMSRAYEKLGNFKEALRWNKEVMKFRDSLLNTETANTILELETKYQLERKEQAIQLQQLQLTQRDLEYRNQEIEMAWQKKLKNLSLIVILMLSVLIFWLIRSLVYRKALTHKLAKQRHDILLKNEELGQLNEELQTQQQQIVIQNEVLLKQNLKIEETHASFQESIRYAEYIQQAVLPPRQRFNQLVPNHFVLYLPKAIVGGDFYWIYQIQNKTFIAVGDCTGHGVPGGFLSMLSITLLKEIVTIKSIHESNVILEQLRNQFIDSLQQTNDLLEYVDGIDISLIVVNHENKTFDFAGAKGKMIIATAQKTELIKGDRNSVGFSPRMKPFTNQVLPLEENQVFYLFTDGFLDQYNNQDEKFGIHRFTELCQQHHLKPMAVQKELFYQTFNQWKGDFEQIDDTTVVAFKF